MKNEQRIERKLKRPQKIIEQKIYAYDEVRDDDVFQTRQGNPEHRRTYSKEGRDRGVPQADESAHEEPDAKERQATGHVSRRRRTRIDEGSRAAGVRNT